MKKQWVFIPALFVLGIVVGVVIMVTSEDAPIAVTRTGDRPVVDTSQQPLSKSEFLADESDTNADIGPMFVLEDKVAELEARIFELEQKLALKSEVSTHTQVPKVNTRFSRLNRMLTTASLIKAGISEEMATDIVRRRNEIELSKLELADRALREGYAGTSRYARELSALMAEKISLREELGDASYDRYLYANKQSNRVKAISVMMGSSAEQAGMKAGDLILTYGELRVFGAGELKNATREGELGDYVNVDILRDGQLMSLWVPRGPLGVRLGFARVAPGE